jgi:hypothetical protein
MRPVVTEACEWYTNSLGQTAALVYVHGPKGHTVSLTGLSEPCRLRFLDVETARTYFGLLRLKLSIAGYAKRKPEMGVV